ncbi:MULTISPECIES: homoserine kinase [unclassified Brevibacterium]|uniref:homoserine kinase n=1 Tax=unclassified Brevibacterium TaxID=2614124 RepID=UPI001BAB0479|nr:homoserine kinase [Brevibacterium sp. W7.2]
MSRVFRLEVPATSANIGPGYDSLGLALRLVDTLVLTLGDAPVDPDAAVTVRGEGAEDVPTDHSHLIMRVLWDVLAQLQGESAAAIMTRLSLDCTNRIPHSRGLGSSAAAVVAGIALAGAVSESLGGPGLTRERMLELAADLEGHPDNAAPAIFGGLTIALPEPARAWTVPVRTVEKVTVLIPAVRLDTLTARGLIPATIAHAVAAENSARTGLLVHALSTDATALLEATDDRLHQEFRRSAYPESMALVDDLRARGIPAVISGAGPTVLALTGDVPAEAVPPGVRAVPVAIDEEGFRLEFA